VFGQLSDFNGYNNFKTGMFLGLI